MNRSFSIVLLLVLLFAAGCGDDKSNSNLASTSDSLSKPDSEVRGAKIFLYDRGEVTTKILATRIVKFEALDSTVAFKLNIDMLDSTGRVTTKVVGDSGIIRDNKGLMKIYGNLDVNVLDTAGKVTTNIVGDSGTFHENNEMADIYGNVVVVTEDSARLETDYLWYDPLTRRIKTDAFVRITRGKDVVTGWGLDADNKLTRIKILNKVSGQLHNVEEAESDSN
jgi:lipopolysaccharide export system protein LptC